MTFRVQLHNSHGWTLTYYTQGLSDSDASARAENIVNNDPEHFAHGPWTAGYSTRET